MIDPLPATHAKGFTLDSVSSACPDCGEAPSVLRARRVIMHAACIECWEECVCEECRQPFHTKLRFYGDRFTFKHPEDGWVTMRTRKGGWLRRILKWITG